MAKNRSDGFIKLLFDAQKVVVASKDTVHSRTLLSWAADGRKTVLKLLLDTEKADVDSKDSECGQVTDYH